VFPEAMDDEGVGKNSVQNKFFFFSSNRFHFLLFLALWILAKNKQTVGSLR
jgi:hypothetical protein